jgi:hypothetical protein
MPDQPVSDEPMSEFNRHNAATLVVWVIALLVGGLLFQAWGWGFAVGAAAGNTTGYVMRRRAGLPDRSLIGEAGREWRRWRARHSGAGRGAE